MVNTKNYRPKNANFILNILGTFLAHNFSTPAPLFINGKPKKLSTQKKLFLFRIFWGLFWLTNYQPPAPIFINGKYKKLPIKK
jgi:hypothetical protein